MQKIFLLFILLITSLSSYSQVQKTQAIIFFTNNDSISAEIKDEPLRVLQKRIQYKLTSSDNFVTVFPNQIKSVKFADGQLFESVKTDSTSLLLLNLVEGYYNLYAKNERNDIKTYYIRHAQDSAIHLVETFTNKYSEEDGKLHRISNFEYIYKLISAMYDNAGMTKEINKTKFREDELVAIVKQYNEFKGNKYPEPSGIKKKSTKISTGVFLNCYPFIDDLQAVGIGMSFDFYKNRPYQRFGLMTRFSVNILEYNKKGNYKFGIEVPFAFSYKYLEKNRLKLYFLGGITSLVFYDSQISYGHRKNYLYGGPLLLLGTGINYKIKESAIRFEFSLLTKSFIFAYIFWEEPSLN